ncbi:tetraketide alpha-pyrone reductase 1 isoform X1 [Selaginella moellendorffii]|uniref:tetraketide alpha-pyrone reductase 1 isoform X1 n=1 Tax=Selaginella moellendorffii TaxID=88036 RepID=UPI000D1C7A59|nr:tetraketide alpha-pyrone reductase 1 isoform X1 [Selaginella moellendorffii]|eukprot:XP_024532702.1 tetraketide alpha-pyrone reductase 1 isoform X1 [Selaginella moellendorffii]
MDSEKVCVTGASGFLASWLVKRLLEEGYYVVGTVRDPDDASKTAHLWELPGARERLDLKKADLITPGAFDDIVQGCHGVFHIAAAVTNRYKEDPLTEIVDPCVLGTLNVLNACKRSTTVKRVVCTSSVAAVSARNDFKPDDVLDESVWSAPDFCREIEMWYGLGKTLSEQAALEFGKENGLDVITIAPSLIVGELLSSRATASVADIILQLQGAKQWFNYAGYVHLDDVAQAHLLAYTNPKASGRYVCSAINMSTIDLASFLSKRYPKHQITDEIEVVSLAEFKGFSSRKLQDELGLQFKSLEQMFDDCIASLERKGLLTLS